MRLRSYQKLVERLQGLNSYPAVALRDLGSFDLQGKRYPLFAVSLGRSNVGKMHICISAGIHGDEPAGVEAAIRFVESNVENESLLSLAHFLIFPCDNPSGWELNTRENAAGIDLNREFAVKHPPDEVALLTKALENQCFDLVVEMHEDIDSPGFYLYELLQDGSKRVGESIVQTLSLCGIPINLAKIIEGAPANCGVISPASVQRFRKTHLPKAVYIFRECGGHIITLEPPASLLTFEKRVETELKGLSMALDNALSSAHAEDQSTISR